MIVDKRVRSEKGEYGISLVSVAVAAGKDVGHSFVIWYYSDESKKMTVHRAVGFYPENAEKLIQVIVGTAGKVLSDSDNSPDAQLTVLVNSDTFEKARAVEKKYENGHTYRLGFDDCTTFVANVSNTIPGIKVPSRVPNLLPAAFIRALIKANQPAK